MSNPSSATNAQYFRYLQSYGANIDKWPDVDRAHAAQWVADNAHAEAHEEAQLDAFLSTAFSQIETPSSLKANILSAATQKTEETTDDVDDVDDISWQMAFTPNFRPIASLVAATFMGIMLGVYMPSFLLNDTTTTQEDYVLYENFIEWDGDSDNG